MTFAKTLQGYLDELGCTSKSLAEASNVSTSSISRYLAGERQPSADSDVPQHLAAGIEALAVAAGRTDIKQDDVALELEQALSGIAVDYDTFARNFHELMVTLGISGNRLAHALGFDPSYISRIQSGQRRPANLPLFIDGVSEYVARNLGLDHAGVATLFGMDAAPDTSPAAIAQAVRTFLGSDVPTEARNNELAHFLETLDEFDFGTYLQNVHFDEIKVPTVPFQLPTTKTYEGIEEMKQAELDFLRAAVLAKATGDVILYSDMPMEEMADDKDFAKKVMIGMAMLIKKGARLQNIHDVHRPLNELIMGLEGWFPIYMTGQVSGYYLEHPTNQTFLHFLRSAETVAVTGEAIADNQAAGRYVVTKHAADVAYYRTRAHELLAHAKPLIRLYFEGDEEKLAAALAAHQAKPGEEPIGVGEGVFKNMEISVLPKHYALVVKSNAPKVHMLIEHPALVNAFANYQPTLY